MGSVDSANVGVAAVFVQRRVAFSAEEILTPVEADVSDSGTRN